MQVWFIQGTEVIFLVLFCRCSGLIFCRSLLWSNLLPTALAIWTLISVFFLFLFLFYFSHQERLLFSVCILFLCTIVMKNVLNEKAKWIWVTCFASLLSRILVLISVQCLETCKQYYKTHIQMYYLLTAVRACMLRRFSRVWLFAALWPVVHQAPLSSPVKNPGVGGRAFLKEIFTTQGSNLCLLHCRRVLYPLSHLGSPISSRVVG